MAKRKSKLASQAALEALVRFGPELSGLKELQRSAEDQFAQSVRQAHGGAAGIINVIDSTRPQVADVYGRAMAGAGSTGSLISHDLQGLGPVADSIKAAASTEAGHQLGNLREAQASALTELGTRRVQAREGEQFAVQSAQGQLAKDLTRVLQRRQDLSREKGAFTAATIGQLTEAAQKHASDVAQKQADRGQRERQSVRTSGIDPDTGKPIPGGRLDPKAKPKKGGPIVSGGLPQATPDAHRSLQSKISAAQDVARPLIDHAKGEGIPGNRRPNKTQIRGYIDYLLRTGVSEGDRTVTVHDTATGKPILNADGTPKQKRIAGVKVPKVDPVIRGAVLDVLIDGHISRKHQRVLQHNGYSIRALGLKSAASAPRQRRRTLAPRTDVSSTSGYGRS